MPSGVIQRGNTQTYERQPTGTLKLYADGSCEATETFTGTWEKRLSNLPVALQPHPDFPTLKLYEFVGAKEPGNIYRYECIYKGILPDTDLVALMQEECSVTTSQEPVETFWKFAYPWSGPPVTTTFLANIQTALETNVSDITTIFPAIAPEAPDGGDQAYNLWLLRRKGIDSYLAMRLNAKLSYVQSVEDFANQKYNTPFYVGLVTHITPDSRLGKAKTIPNNPGSFTTRNYLFSGLSWRLQGGVVSVVEEYSLSGGNGKWQPYLYGEDGE